MQFSSDHPSLFRSLLFVLSSTLVGVVAFLLFIGEVFWGSSLEFFLVDLLRWGIGGLVLILLGVFFLRIPLGLDSFLRALSMLSHVNFYGFLMFAVGSLLLPVVTIPDVLGAMQQLNDGVIGPAEWDAVLSQSLSGNLINPLSVLFFLVSMLFLLYAVYGMFLAVNQYLKTTVFKSILVMIVLVVVQSMILFFLFP